jgi:hypothetical protein
LRRQRRAQALEKAGELTAAETALRRTVSELPWFPAANLDLANFLSRRGRGAEARVYLDRASAAVPPDLPLELRALIDMAAFELAMQEGDFSECWRYESRRAMPQFYEHCAAAPSGVPEWKGEPLDGKRLVLVPEQGLGDQIQFVRFTRLYAEMGADVTLMAREPLVRLFRMSGTNAASGPVDATSADFWSPLMSAMYRLGVTPRELPSAPYLFAEPKGCGGRIGVAWNGNPQHHNDHNRSLPSQLGAELLALPGVISLKPEDTGAADFADTAAIVAGLDLVITVDTSVAHLAGAMGKPVWILLPEHGCDWRWMRGRTDSPWYPSATLYRQLAPGDWRSVLDRVKADLAAWRGGLR